MENKNFKTTQQFKDSVIAVLGRLPFERVNQIMPLVERDMLSENEINTVIGEMGRMPWIDVKDFFTMLSSMISEVFIEPTSLETSKGDDKKPEPKQPKLKVSK